MDAKPSNRLWGRGGGWADRPWLLTAICLLVLAGVLIQACSDNKGPSGPQFAGGPAKTPSVKMRSSGAAEWR